MAATIARAQGFQKHGGAQNGQATRLGYGSVEASAATLRTFASVRVKADGSGMVEVKRDGQVIDEFRFGPETGGAT